MTEQRSLADAFEQTPEVHAFITGTTPGGNKEPSTVESNNQPSPATSTGRNPKRDSGSPRKSKSVNKVKKAAAEAPRSKKVLATLSTRVEQSLKERLDEACFVRKRAGQSHFSQQDIVELAIADWLNKHHP